MWAELVRNLYYRGSKKKLSATDQEYYGRRDMLAGEIALAEGCTIEAASKRIEDRLRACALRCRVIPSGERDRLQLLDQNRRG